MGGISGAHSGGRIVFGAIIRAAAGFIFGALIGGFISTVINFARPIVVDGVGESHQIVAYMDAIAEFWILIAFFGALMGVVVAGVVESGPPGVGV